METLLQGGPQKEFFRKLLAWYGTDGRHDMPWRKTKDPYAVVVSEFMLQQTTVGTVRPYYERFLARFPTIKSLAEADLNEVLALWSGLGYYARARNLWSAMRAVVEKHKGKIPPRPEDLEALPGIGPYTAGAIASFAFNRPAAVLDGNVMRVLLRVLGIEDDPKLKAAQVVLKKVSLDLCALGPTAPHAKGGPRDLNLALMDLGATLCSPQVPKCMACPVAKLCVARAFGKQELIPMKGEKIERPTIRRLHAVVERKGKWLMGQRPPQGLFGGLWEFPGLDAPEGTEPVNALEESIQQETGLLVRVRQALPAFEQQLTHRVFFVRTFLCEVAATPGSLLRKGKNYSSFRWVLPDELSQLGISSITRRMVAQARRTTAS